MVSKYRRSPTAGPYRRVTPEMRREVMRLAAQGLTYKQILARVDTSVGRVTSVLRPLGGVIRTDMLAPTGRRLSLAERVEIRVGLERGWSYHRIGAELGRAASTVCREVAAGAAVTTTSRCRRSSGLWRRRGGPSRASWQLTRGCGRR